MDGGAFVLQLFGDAATELLIRHDGDEGLFLTYSEVQFTAPVYAGDYIEVVGKITEVGNTSRKMEFTAVKQITAPPTKPNVAPHPQWMCWQNRSWLPEPKGGSVLYPRINKERDEIVSDVIITAALTGAEVTREQQKNLPITPQEIGQAAVECYEAGAAIVHVHARLADGSPTQDKEVYGEIKKSLKMPVPLSFNLPPGGRCGTVRRNGSNRSSLIRRWRHLVREPVTLGAISFLILRISWKKQPGSCRSGGLSPSLKSSKWE